MKHILDTIPGYTIELTFWAGAICLLAIADPFAAPLIELCPFRLLGVSGCPGCGMGHAISFLLDGEFAAAITRHPLSPFALAGITDRVRRLAREVIEPRSPGY